MENSLGRNLKVHIKTEDEIMLKQAHEKAKELQTAQFKKLLWTFGKTYFNRMDRPFIVDKDNRQFLDVISQYFSNNPSFEKATGGELRKGLLVYGPCGTGKSSVFDIIGSIGKHYQHKSLWFRNVSVHTVVSEFNSLGEKVIEKYSKGTVHFEDLGTEKIAQSWGIKENLFERLLQIRYNIFKENGTKTYITTNLSTRSLEAMYGAQVYDRIFEMFNFIELGGGSRRR
ncbi:hypothetical protein MTsPCn5_17010 [Croceitalea sp. MTPC5]|uniref:Uncharacterized protein n=1 Tax=Croceitalea marina TaxID=1775166 RepID=A0ABW5MWC2_9FLAO|nr:hypothetical protein MTsPCn5_17010 [Croceitalea sp. MTPC5]